MKVHQLFEFFFHTMMVLGQNWMFENNQSKGPYTQPLHINFLLEKERIEPHWLALEKCQAL
jgi:hypothetical protein